MKVFESLNCILCKEPFDRVANQPRSPRHLDCGVTMCHECFQKEKSRKKDERKHQCDVDDCFFNKNFAHFLIDVLSQDALTIAPMEGGYVLSKPFKIPECVICHDEYSIIVEEKKSFVLGCNHIICTECCLKTRAATTVDGWKYEIACPNCRKKTLFDEDEYKDRFQDFLGELPEMIHQLESTLKAPACAECNKKYIIDEMFHCFKCSSEICGTCAYMKHRKHGAVRLLGKKASETFKKLRGETTNVIKTYKYLIPGLHKDILNDLNSFEKKLLSQEETIKNAPTFVDLQTKNELLAIYQTGFETMLEEYLPHLRKLGTKLKKSIQTLDKNVPVSKNSICKRKMKRKYRKR